MKNDKSDDDAPKEECHDDTFVPLGGGGGKEKHRVVMKTLTQQPLPKEEEDEVEVITVVASGETTSGAQKPNKKIGTDDFIKKLLHELDHNVYTWRNVIGLAKSLDVEVDELCDWLDGATGFLRKAVNSGIYYCLESRYAENIRKPSAVTNNKKPKAKKVQEEHYYALAILHMVYGDFYSALKTYSLEINQLDTEIFKYLTISLDKLESGLVLLSKKSGATMEKLPRFTP